MNIRYLQKLMSGVENIIVIDKNARINNVLCNVMGMLRQEMKWQLLILQYDEDYPGWDEEVALHREEQEKVLSNREILQRNHRDNKMKPFQAVRGVRIGKEEYVIKGMMSRRLGRQEWDQMYLISEFLRRGWKPKEIACKNVDMLLLVCMEIEGKDGAGPDFGEKDTVHFIMGKDHTHNLVEMPVTLTVNSGPCDKLWFRDAVTSEEHWLLINRVYLLDIRANWEQALANPRLLKHMAPEEIERTRSDLEGKLREFFPGGTYFPVIEYECEESISFQFYSKAYLDAAPVHHRNGSMGFIVQPEQPVGVSGLQLKAAILHEPVPENTASIEAELFEYIKGITPEDIILE